MFTQASLTNALRANHVSLCNLQTLQRVERLERMRELITERKCLRTISVLEGPADNWTEIWTDCD